MSSDCTWKHLILRSHAEVTLNSEICRSTQKWSNKQDDWWCTQFIFIADWMSMHWSNDETDAHTEIN